MSKTIYICFIFFLLIIIIIGASKEDKELLTMGIMCLMIAIFLPLSGFILQTMLENMVQTLSIL